MFGVVVYDVVDWCFLECVVVDCCGGYLVVDYY